MEIKRVGSQPSAKGSPEWFTGTARVDPLFEAPDPARVSGANVTFELGARTAWHTHSLFELRNYPELPTWTWTRSIFIRPVNAP